MKPSLLAFALVTLVATTATPDPVYADDAPAGALQVAAITTPAPHPMSGGRALGIGIASTFAPAALSLIVNPPGSHGTIAWEASLATGAALGVMVGPAVGLASGGRGDLARRGLVVRGCGAALAGLGLYQVVMAMSNDGGTPATVPLMLLGIAGGGATVVSFIHDLAITPSAVDARAHAVQVGFDQRGRLAATLRF